MPRKSDWPAGTEVEKTALTLPKKILHRARIQAVVEGRTLQEVVADALRNYLKQPTGGERR